MVVGTVVGIVVRIVGTAVVTTVVGTVVDVLPTTSNQSIFWPVLRCVSRSTCVPAESFSGAATVVNAVALPVFGTFTVQPAKPSTVTTILQSLDLDPTWNRAVYVPLVGTTTVYSVHSLLTIHPMLVIPFSVCMSTPSDGR
ncbi:hypothetical protein DSECCO2_555580 [anaerobic digester metagenome]